MKKIWKCPHCKQMSTRHGNLKRHIARQHRGIGTPILQYISGNSIFTPAVAPTYRHVLNDENDVFKRPAENRIFHSKSSHIWKIAQIGSTKTSSRFSN
jgi:hypothetical protein